MGADSCATDDNDHSYIIAKNTKIFRKNEIIIGCCNSFRIINIIQFLFNPPKIKTELFKYMVTEFVPTLRNCLEEHKIDTDSESMGLTILVGIQNAIFEVQNDFAVILMPEYGAAIGSGGQVARGSLYTTKDGTLAGSQRVLMALQTAEATIASVRGPFDILEK